MKINNEMKAEIEETIDELERVKKKLIKLDARAERYFWSKRGVKFEFYQILRPIASKASCVGKAINNLKELLK